jgi:xylulokinase
MAESYLLGVDIGTQGVKCSLFDLDGNSCGNSFVPSNLIQPEPGVTEENADFQVDSVCAAISRTVRESGVDSSNILALSIDGQMAGVIGVGENGFAVTPYDSWLDTRCTPYITIMQKEAGKEILGKTGNPPSFNHGPKKLWWKNECPQIYKKIRSFVQPGGYAAMRLCGLSGEDAFIDKSYLHFSGFADNQAVSWDRHLVSVFDMDMEKLPRIVKPADIIGEMTEKMAKKCGLSNPLPVAAGCGDTAASFLSCGAVSPGICVDVAGTASVFASTTETFCADTETGVLGCGASAVDGLWHPYAYINGGGMNLEWFVRDILGRDPEDPDRFKDIEGDISYISESNPLFIPHMAGRVSPSQPSLRGTFSGLEWSHDNKTLFMSVLEGVALEYGIYRQSLLGMLPHLELKEMRITGGGDKSRVWKQMKSGVLQIPVTSITNSQGAPLGSAIIAGCAVGIFDNPVSAAEKWISTEESVECPVENYKYFTLRTKKYEKLLTLMNSFYGNDNE